MSISLAKHFETFEIVMKNITFVPIDKEEGNSQRHPLQLFHTRSIAIESRIDNETKPWGLLGYSFFKGNHRTLPSLQMLRVRKY